MNIDYLRQALKEKGLRITPQRLAVLGAVVELDNHPTAEEVMAHVKRSHPNIAMGTVYKVLEALVEKDLVAKVMTDKYVMHYEATADTHHHLYCSDSGKIADYENAEINALIENYFAVNQIPGFEIATVKLQINGRFLDPGGRDEDSPGLETPQKDQKIH